jgi:hypothetical protein
VLTPQDRAIELSVESEEGGAVKVSRGSGLGLRFTDGSGGTDSARVCRVRVEWVMVG